MSLTDAQVFFQAQDPWQLDLSFRYMHANRFYHSKVLQAMFRMMKGIQISLLDFQLILQVESWLISQ